MGRRILIVDGSAEARQVQSFVLTSAGYDVLEAVDGPDALRRLDGGRVHLVIASQALAGLDGVSLVRSIRKAPAHRFTPVVLITTEPEGPALQEARAAGATGWLVRPFTPDQLLAVVRRVVGAQP